MCESTDDSSSANFKSDKEAFEIIKVNTENDKEEAEEVGFEGICCLMGSQGRELEVQLIDDAEKADKLGELGEPVETNVKWDTELLGEQISVDNDQILIEGQRTGRVEVLQQEVQGFISEEGRPQFKVGKMGLSSK